MFDPTLDPMLGPTTRPAAPATPAGQLTGIRVSPPLDRSEVAFLAGLAAGPLRDHDGVVVVSGEVSSRVWPGQPRSVAPVLPCASGCCLVVPARCGGLEPGLAAQWLRFLVDTFLVARHHVDGGVVVPVRGGGAEVVLVDDGEVFEGVLDPAGGWPA